MFINFNNLIMIAFHTVHYITVNSLVALKTNVFIFTFIFLDKIILKK